MDDSEPDILDVDDMEVSVGDADTTEFGLLKRFRKQTKPVQETGGAAASSAPSGADVYDLSAYPKRGIALIIANSKFKRMAERKGCTMDTSRIYQTVKRLGLEPQIYENQKACEIRDLMIKASQADYSYHAMFVCIITSHGDRYGVYGSDDIGVNLKKLAGHLKGDKCPTLAGKPKLFFIQACRGNTTDPGVSVEQTDANPDKSIKLLKKTVCTIPTSADFLMSYSTVRDYYAFLNQKRGSRYIQTLSDELERCDGHTEISIVLQRVTNTVAFTFTSSTTDPTVDKKKQCPCYTSTLTKQLYLDASKK